MMTTTNHLGVTTGTPSFWRYLIGAIIRPHRTFTTLATDPQRLTYGTPASLLIGSLYTLTVTGLAVA